MTEPVPRPRNVPALDGVRGLALLGMLCYHSQAPWAKGAIFTISVFFTLSGFLIGSLLLDERRRSGTIDLARFWVRRVRRLLPGSLLCLALVVVFGLLVADQTQRANLRGDVLASLAYVANWRFIFNGTEYLNALSSPSPVLHFWSLAIEEQFYLVLPLVALLLMGRRRRGDEAVSADRVRWRLGAGVGLLFVVSATLPWWVSMSRDRVYLGSDTRAAELLVGVLLAVLWARTPLGSAPPSRRRRMLLVLGPLALGVMVASWVLVGEQASWIYRGGLAAYSLVSATVVAAAAVPGNPVSRLLGVRWLAGVGRLSYGVYLYHWPVFLWLTPARVGLEVDPARPDVAFWSLMALRLAVTFVLAWCSYRFVEGPFRHGMPVWGQPLRRVGPVLAGAVVVALLVSTIGVQKGTVAVAAEQQESLRSDPGAVIDRSSPLPGVAELALPASSVVSTTTPARPQGVDPFTTTTTWATVPGGLQPKPYTRPARKLRLLVVGDSSAVFLAFALDGWNRTARVFDLNAYGLMGCPVARGGTEFSTGMEKQFAPICSQWEPYWRDAIARSQPDLIMVATSYHDVVDRRMTPGGPWQHIGQPAFDGFLAGEYGALGDLLSTAGVPVLWLDNPPVREGQNQPNAALANDPGNDPRRMDRLNVIVEQVAAARPLIHVVRYAKFFWTWPGGPFDPRLREDGLHVDYDGRRIVGDWLGPELLDAYWTALLSRSPGR